MDIKVLQPISEGNKKEFPISDPEVYDIQSLSIKFDKYFSNFKFKPLANVIASDL